MRFIYFHQIRKRLLLLLILYIPFFTEAQDTSNVDWQRAFDTLQSRTAVEEINTFVRPFVDSLNNYKEGDLLPSFLKDYKFDETNLIYWKSIHAPISLRKMIFDNIINKKVLNAIMESSEKSFQIKNSDMLNKKYALVIPFSSYSNRDLAQYRLEELKQSPW